MNEREYLNDWPKFLEFIISLFKSGVQEEEISKKISGSEICWIGDIAEIKTGKAYAPGVALNMQPETVELGKLQRLRADYIFLNTDENTKKSWKDCKPGDRVKFKAVISNSPGPFPAVQLCVDENDPEVLLMLGLHRGEYVSRITRK